jgi:hypothetical protein
MNRHIKPSSLLLPSSPTHYLRPLFPKITTQAFDGAVFSPLLLKTIENLVMCSSCWLVEQKNIPALRMAYKTLLTPPFSSSPTHYF